MLNRGDSLLVSDAARVLFTVELRIIEGQKVGEEPDTDSIRAGLLLARDKINAVLEKVNS